MESNVGPQLTGVGQMAADDVCSDKWFARYILDAGFLVALALTAFGIALYVDGGEYLRDWSKELGASFLACMLLCPMLGVMTLGLVIYASIRLFQRPRTLGHTFVRSALLVAHVSVFLVCAETILSTATAVMGNLGQSSLGTDPAQAWRTIDGRDFPGSQYDEREGKPDDPPFPPPSDFGAPGLAIPGRGTSSR